MDATNITTNPAATSANQKRHARRARRRAAKKEETCFCQDLMAGLADRVNSMDKSENNRYSSFGICVCPMHGRTEFEAFYVRNTRDVDLSGFCEDGKCISYTMH